MKFWELIKSNNWLSIEMVLLKLYPDEKKNIADYEEVFNKLKIMQPKETAISVLVSWEKDDFDQTDYVDVSGYYNILQDNSAELTNSLAIEFTPWNEWLGMELDANMLKIFSELEIISHCLFEMTFVGFEEEDIQAKMDRINKTVEEIKNMTEEEKKVKLKSWDDLKQELKLEDENKEEN